MAKYTNKGLIKFARQMCEYNAPYWYGTLGNYPANEALFRQKQAQYPSNYPPKKWTKASFEAQYGKKVADCAGLIKAYLMSPCIDADGYVTDFLKASVYNSKYDFSANMFIQNCSETGDINTIPEEEGLIVWKDGHVGIYEGKGYLIEERGHAFGCVRSKLADRPFVKWGRLSMIEYVKDDPHPAPSPVGKGISLPGIKKGDKNDQVTLLQLLLNDLGYRDQNGDLLVIDGSAGGKTIYSLNAFKKANGMAKDSVCTEATWDKLLHKRFKEYPKK